MKSTEEIAGYKRSSCYIEKIVTFRNINTVAKKSTMLHSFLGVKEFIQFHSDKLKVLWNKPW